MSAQQEGADPSLDGIYQQITPTLVDDEPRSFKPWHKPRKHFLRVSQWCALLRTLLSTNGNSEGDTIRYLGLPGEDFLDVRTLEGVCERAKVKLKYLGFDSSADIEEHEILLARHEISALTFVDPFSVLARENIEKLSHETSIARETFRRVGPFDVINLDICDSIVNSVGEGSYFDALTNICNLQLECGRGKPWLVFISTRAIRTQLEGTARQKLFECVLGNIDASPEFAGLLNEKLALNADVIKQELAGEQLLGHGALVNAIAIGISKWLLKLTMSAQPKVSVKLLPSYSYRVELAQPDMLSLAFLFAPVLEPRKDAVGLSSGACVETPQISEVDLGIELIGPVAEIKDVDQLLANDSHLYEKVVKASGKILSSARYDVEKYNAWVGNSPVFGTSDHADGGLVLSDGGLTGIEPAVVAEFDSQEMASE